MMHPLAAASLYALFGLLVSLLLHAQTVEVPCYAPDGRTIAPNDSFVPCNKLGITQTGAASSCCLLDGDQPRDLCASTGLCINNGILRREFCTDKTWQNPACVKVCTDPAFGGSMNSSVELTPCTDGTYCCGHNNLTCCGSKDAFTVPTLSLVTSNSSTTVTATATVTATPNPGVPAVAGLGIGLGVALIATSATILYLQRQNKRLKKNNKALAAASAASSSPHFDDYHRPMSFMPPSTTGSPSNGAPTVAPSARGSRVPSMQEFAAFKAMYDAYQLQEAVSTHRLSELDATTVAAAAHFRNSMMAAAPPAFEQIREDPAEHLPPEQPPAENDNGMGQRYYQRYPDATG